MNIALPILLLVLGGLTLWILSESTLKWYIKVACISIFCVFTVIFWGTTHTFLGWVADGEDAPEKVKIHWVIIKEPNKLLGEKGQIYILLESADRGKVGFISKVFGYKKKRKVEPRLHGVPYSRELHEQIEKKIMPKLKRGQPVVGKLSDVGGDGRKGEGKGKKKGGGSESQSQGWEFHELLPSDFQRKPE